jgi:LacI family transcriptional regulator
VISIKDVAKRAGVSVGTVSNVINRPDLVAAETRGRVQAVIRELGYVRSETARALRVGRSRMLALLVLDLGNPFFVDLARGAEQAARAAGLMIMVCNTGQDVAEEERYLSLLAEQRVRGVLITPDDADGSDLGLLRSHGIPYVLADRVTASEEACSVSVDDVKGGAMAVRHLIENGHTRIAFINGPAHLTQCRDRLAGVRSMVRDSGLPADALRVLETPQLDVACGRDAGARLLGLTPRPSAVFCANDLLALGVLQAMFAAGVRVPEQIALVGYDDIEFAAAAAVPLTSVRQPARRIGSTAAQLLIEETSGENAGHVHQRVVYEPELVVRRSSLAGSPG